MSGVKNVGGGERTVVSPAKRRRRVFRIFLSILFVMVVMVIVAGLYLLAFLSGKPKPTVDYVALLNQMTRVEGRSEADNAWPDYEKAIELLHEWNNSDPNLSKAQDASISHRDLNEAEQKAVETWIEQNDAAWRALVRAANKPYCWREYRLLRPNDPDLGVVVGDTPMMPIGDDLLGSLENLLDLARWRIRVHVRSGRTQAAVDDCLALIKAGAQWRGDKLVVESHMGLSLTSTGYYSLLGILTRAEVSKESLRDLADQLRGVEPDPRKIWNLRSDRLLFLDVVQHWFTRGGIGGGHLIPKSLWPLVCECSVKMSMGPLPTQPPFHQQETHMLIALLHARRNATVAQYEALNEQTQKIVTRTPHEVRASGLRLPVECPDIVNREIHLHGHWRNARYFVVSCLALAASRLGELAHEDRAVYDAVLTVIAAKRYQSDRGDYPQSLEQLVQAGYIAHLPLDPYSDKPLVYRRMETGFLLYSVGHDMKDDGGTVATLAGHPQSWGTETDGDALFWPPQ
jgi:hypothetical protein